MTNKIVQHTKTQHADALAHYLPGGVLFRAKRVEGSVMRRLLDGLACEMFTAEEFLLTLQNEYIPDTTVKFIEEWERALGIPDECFSNTGTLDERRRNILAKLASLGVQTEADFISLALVFGLVVTIEQGATGNVFPLGYPITFFGTPKEAFFTIIVSVSVASEFKFPLDYPLPFGDPEVAILKCLFANLIPINCQVIFNEI